MISFVVFPNIKNDFMRFLRPSRPADYKNSFFTQTFWSPPETLKPCEGSHRVYSFYVWCFSNLILIERLVFASVVAVTADGSALSPKRFGSKSGRLNFNFLKIFIVPLNTFLSKHDFFMIFFSWLARSLIMFNRLLYLDLLAVYAKNIGPISHWYCYTLSESGVSLLISLRSLYCAGYLFLVSLFLLFTRRISAPSTSGASLLDTARYPRSLFQPLVIVQSGNCIMASGVL